MAITKVTSGLISADAASVDLNIDAGTLYIDATNNRVGVGNTSPSVALDVTGAVTLSGTLTASSLIYPTSDGTSGQALVTDGSGNLSFSTIQGYTDSDVESYLDGGTSTPTFASATVTGEITANGGIALGTNDKATFGASDTFEIYTDDTDSFIKETAAGSLKLLGTNIDLANAANTELGLRFITNGAVTLYYDGSAKIATTSTGIDVTGTISSGDITVNDQIIASGDSNTYLQFHAADQFRVVTGGAERLEVNTSETKLTAGNLNVISGQYLVNGTAVIDTSRNLTNIGTISSGAITAKSGSTTTQSTFSNFISNNAVVKAVVNHANEYGLYMGYVNATTDTNAIQSGRASGTTDELALNPFGGNVGIGTASPEEALHVSGNMVLDRSSPRLFFQTGATHYNWKVSAQDAVNKGFEISSGEVDADANSDTYTARLVIEGDTGEVGIGTTNPLAKLHVSNGGAEGIEIYPASGGNINFIQHYNRSTATYVTSRVIAAEHRFEVGTTESMRIDSSGNVGIGTTSPGSILHLYANDPQILLDDSGTQSSITGQSGNILYKTSSTNRDHTFYGVNTEVARITGDANFSITGGNWSGADRFNLSVTQFDAGATFQTGEFLLFGDHDGSRDKMLALKRAGSDVVVVDSGGAVIIGGSSSISKLTVIDEGEVNGEVAWFKGGSNYGAVNVFARGTSYTWAHGIGGSSSTNANIPASYYGIEERAATNRPVRLAISHTHGEVSINASYSGSTFPFRVGYSTDGTLDNYTPTFVIDDDGDVGIGLGVGTPADTLHIEKSTTVAIKLARTGVSELRIVSSTAAVGNIIDAEDNDLTIKTSTAEPISFETNDSERMRINSSGQVSINDSTDPDNSAEMLQVRGTNNAVAPIVLRNASGDQSAYRMIHYYKKEETSPIAITALDVTGSAVTHSYLSDERLKDELGSADGLNLISELNPIKFRFKDGTGTGSQGFTAQGFKQAFDNVGSFPRGVTVPDNPDEYWLIDDKVLIPNLVKAIQELKEENDNLKARIEVIENG